MEICRNVHYWGRVQGVGFRATVQEIADRHAVTGFVRNLPEGEVEVVVAGEADEVGRFLAAIDQRMARFIRGSRIDDEPKQAFRGFEIRM